MKQLHRDNISIVFNFLCRNNVSTPAKIVYEKGHIKDSLFLDSNIVPYMKCDDPLMQVRRLLNIYDLVMLPSDKTKTVVITSKECLKEEMKIHLSDTSTYKLLSEEDHLNYTKVVQQTVIEASRYYKSNLWVPSPSNRYIYFLPKTHKNITQWRSIYHPKMRPIICDTNSITYKLSKYLLPLLQKIEQKIQTTVTSSIDVVHSLISINRNSSINSTPVILSTVDVDSLFTRIPQDKLLHIVDEEMDILGLSPDYKSHFLRYLQVIINYNIFKVNDAHYLQTIGLPMGGRLSGTLANIYLGVLEKDLSKEKKIILFQRYMDDLLLITRFNQEELHLFMERLKEKYQLPLTVSHNYYSVNFLDMSISYSKVTSQFIVTSYSKNKIPLPLPSLIKRRGIQQEFNIIRTQILRLSIIITKYLQLLHKNIYMKAIRRKLFIFLKSVKISTHSWSVNIPLCQSCSIICQSSNIIIDKIMRVGDKFLSIKEPLNCHSTNIYIIKKYEIIHELYFLSSIHEYLLSTKEINLYILPLGKLRKPYIYQLLKKHKDIYCADEISTISSSPFCYIHDVYKDPTYIYGLRTKKRRNLCVKNFFSIYKRLWK
jgi:hypothetical protein